MLPSSVSAPPLGHHPSVAPPKSQARSFNGSWSFELLIGQFVLKPKDKDGTSYKAGVKVKDETRYHSAKLELQEIDSQEFCQLSPRSFARKIEITVQPNEAKQKKYTVFLNRKAADKQPAVQNPNPEEINISSYPIKIFDFFSLANALDLAAALRKGKNNAYIDQIVNEMVRRFQQPGIPHSTYIREMVAPLAVISAENRYNVVHKFVTEIETDPLNSSTVVKGLMEALRALVRATYQKIITLNPRQASISWGEFEKRPVETFSANQLIKIAQTLCNKLPEISDASTYDLEESDKGIYLEAIIAVIEMMVMAQVKDVERVQFHEPIYEALDAADLDSDLRVAYLACMGKQLWAKIPDNETKLHGFIRHSIHFGKFLIELYKVYANKELAPLINAGKELLETFKFQDSEEDWFKTIFSLRNAILGENVSHLRGLKYLIDLADLAKVKGERANNDEKEAQKLVGHFKTNNPFFARALLLLLQEVLEYYVEDDPETGKVALLLLQRICTDNFDRKESKHECLFHVHMGAYKTLKRFVKKDVKEIIDRGEVKARNSSYAKQLKEEAFNIIKRIAVKHPSIAMQKVAAASARFIYANDPASADLRIQLNLPVPVAAVFPSAFFETVVQAICPWQKGLRELRNKFYRDYQIRELQYHVDMQAEAVPDGQHINVEAEMKKFTDPYAPDDGTAVNTILLSGPAGSGKTLTAKKTIDALWKNSSLKTYIPLQVILGTAKDPKNALNELLEKHGLMDYINLFRSGDLLRFFIWIDGIDENSVGMNINWPEALEANEWKNSKFMYGIRSDMMREADKQKPKFCYPNGETALNFKHLSLCPLDPSRRLQFFQKFIAQFASVFQIEWKPEQFVSYLSKRPNLERSASNPLLIRVTVITLPRIVAKNKKEGKENAEIVEYEMMDAYFCYMVSREQHRQRLSSEGIVVKDPAEYLNYTLKAAKAIHDYSLTHNKAVWMPDEYAKEHHPDLFNDDPLTRMKQRCSSLVFSNGCVGFYHSLYFEQCLQLLKNAYRKRELEKHLETGSYEFESLFY